MIDFGLIMDDTKEKQLLFIESVRHTAQFELKNKH